MNKSLYVYGHMCMGTYLAGIAKITLRRVDMIFSLCLFEFLLRFTSRPFAAKALMRHRAGRRKVMVARAPHPCGPWLVDTA
jgi:hypothetical protein